MFPVYSSQTYVAMRARLSGNLFFESGHVPIHSWACLADLYLRFLFCFDSSRFQSRAAFDDGAVADGLRSASRPRDVHSNPRFQVSNLIRDHDANIDL